MDKTKLKKKVVRMLKNKTFQNGLLWLIITGIVTYSGLYLATGYNVFIQGAWAGVALANAVIRFGKAYLQEKSKGAN
jgi:hypothetical protein